MVTGAALDAVIRQLPFDLKNGARVLYLADSHLTCLSEVQRFSAPHFAVAIVPVQVQLQATIDLGDVATLALLQTTQAEWALNFRLRPNPTPSQELGEACARAGCVDEIVYPSLAQAGGLDVAIIEAALVGGAVVVDDPATKLRDQLP